MLDGYQRLILIKVRHHAAHIQVLDHDRVVFANEISGQLLQTVATNIGNLLMDLGNFDACLVPVKGTLFLAGQRFVRFLRLCHLAAHGARSVVAGPIVESGKGFQSQIDSDLAGSFRHSGQHFIDTEGNVVFAGWGPADMDCSWLALKVTRPTDVHLADLSKAELPASPLKSCPMELGGLVTDPLLEAGIFRTMLPEVHEGGLQVPQRTAALERH